jgi:hypothetical protein
MSEKFPIYVSEHLRDGRNYYGGAGIGVDGKLEVNFEKYYQSGGTYGDNLPTAVIVVSAGDAGLIVASDSQGSFGDYEQKIFCTVGPTWTVIYALSGAVSNYKLGLDNFKQVYRDTASALTNSDPAPLDLSDYANKFIQKVGETLKSYFQDKDEKMTIHFAGCFNGNNSLSVRTLHFKSNAWRIASSSDDIDPKPGACRYVGSESVMRRLLTGAPDFSKFSAAAKFAMIHRDGESRTDFSLQDAVDVARNYVDACKSELGKKLDPDHCNFIGGQTVIASVTLAKGFLWVDKLIPFSS